MKLLKLLFIGIIPNTEGSEKTNISKNHVKKSCQKHHKNQKCTNCSDSENNASVFKRIKEYYFSKSIKDVYSSTDCLMEYFFKAEHDTVRLNKELSKLNKSLLHFRWKNEYTIAKYTALRKHSKKGDDYLNHIKDILARLDEIIIQASIYLKENPLLNGDEIYHFIREIKHIIKHCNLFLMDYIVLTHEDLSIKDVAKIVWEEEHHKSHGKEIVFKTEHTPIKPKRHIMKFILEMSKRNFAFNEELIDKLEHHNNLTQENITYILKQILIFDKSFKIPLRILKALFDVSDSAEFKELEEMYKKFDSRWKKFLNKNNKFKAIVENMEKEIVHKDYKAGR